MNRSSDPVLPRMPGSAILAVVFFGLNAIIAVGAGFVLLSLSLIPLAFALVLIGVGFLHTAIAIGITKQQPWARLTGIILSSASIALSLLDLLLAAAEGAPSTGGAGLGLSILLLYFLTRQNTRAWCNDLGPAETPLGLAPPEPFLPDDQVELVESIEGIGLQVGAVGTVVELPAVPGTILVEFDDHPDREPIQVTLHVSEVRPVAEAQ